MTLDQRIKMAENRLQAPARILSKTETDAALLAIDQDALLQLPDNDQYGILTGRQIKSVLGGV